MNLVGRGPRDPDIKMMTMKPHGQYSRIDPHRRKDSLTDDDTSVSDDSGIKSLFFMTRIIISWSI